MAIVSDERVLTQLRRYNQWWSGSHKPAPTFHRVAFRRCYDLLTREDWDRAVLLSGPRRVGKSTILHQVAHRLIRDGHDPRSVLYATLDDNILKLAGIEGAIRAFQENVWPSGKPAFLLLDEVHYAHGWDTALKTLIDHSPELRILATGSAALETGEALSHSGVGRWTTVPIPTLSFYEFLHLVDQPPAGVPSRLRPSECGSLSKPDLLQIQSAMEPTLPLFREYLLVGGFPETAKRRSDIGEAQRLLREDVVDRVLKRDITALFGVRNVSILEKLFLYVCLNSGLMLNIQKCAKEIGTSRTTIDNHLQVLVQANLLYKLEPSLRSGKQVLRPQNKYYLVDAALRNAILLSGTEILDDPREAGVIVETAILRHLMAFYYRDTPRLTYWRGQNDAEVDIVVRGPRYAIGTEVKYRERIRPEDLAGAAEFEVVEQPDKLFIITKNQQDFGLRPVGEGGRPVAWIPAHIFTYLIGQAEREQ